MDKALQHELDIENKDLIYDSAPAEALYGGDADAQLNRLIEETAIPPQGKNPSRG